MINPLIVSNNTNFISNNINDDVLSVTPVTQRFEQSNIKNKHNLVSAFVLTFVIANSSIQVINPMWQHSDKILCSENSIADSKSGNNFKFMVLENPNSEYNTITKLNSSLLYNNGDENAMNNIEKIREIGQLGYDWNDNGAEPFSNDLIELGVSIVSNLKIQPKVYPTARQSLQFEYEDKDGRYLEFEIFEESTNVLYVDEEGNEEEMVIGSNAEDVNKVVSGHSWIV